VMSAKKLSKREARLKQRQATRDAKEAREEEEILFHAERIMRARAAVARTTAGGAAAVGAAAGGDKVTPGSQLFQDGLRAGGIGRGTDGSVTNDGTRPQPYPSLAPSGGTVVTPLSHPILTDAQEHEVNLIRGMGVNAGRTSGGVPGTTAPSYVMTTPVATRVKSPVILEATGGGEAAGEVSTIVKGGPSRSPRPTGMGALTSGDSGSGWHYTDEALAAIVEQKLAQRELELRRQWGFVASAGLPYRDGSSGDQERLPSSPDNIAAAAVAAAAAAAAAAATAALPVAMTAGPASYLSLMRSPASAIAATHGSSPAAAEIISVRERFPPVGIGVSTAGIDRPIPGAAVGTALPASVINLPITAATRAAIEGKIIPPPASRHSKSDLKLEKYDGTTSVETFFVQFEDLSAFQGWDEDERRVRFRAALRGAATSILWELSGAASVEDHKSSLAAHFGNADQVDSYQAELKLRRRKPGETLQSVYQEISRMMAMGYPGQTGPVIDKIGRDYFLVALEDSKMHMRILERGATDLRSALAYAKQHEAYLQVSGCAPQTAIRATKTVPRYVKTLAAEPTEDIHADDRSDRLEQLMKEMATEQQQLRALLVQKPRGGKARVNTASAGGEGALAVVSTDGSAQNTVRDRGRGRGGWRGRGRGSFPTTDRRCYNCDQPGHISRECTQPRRISAYTPQAATTPSSTLRAIEAPPAEHNNSAAAKPVITMVNMLHTVAAAAPEPGVKGQLSTAKRAVFLRLTVEGKRMASLLDTGCDLSVIGSRVLPGLQIRPTKCTLFAANGASIPLLGEADISVVAGTHHSKLTVLVTDALSELILGIDWLEENRCIWCFHRRVISVGGQLLSLQVRTRPATVNRLYVGDTIIIPPRQVQIVPTDVVWTDWNTQRVDFVTEPREISPGLLAARTLIAKDAWTANVMVMNLTDQPQRLDGGKLLLLAQPVAEEEDSITPVPDPDPEIAAKFVTIRDGRCCVVSPDAIPPGCADSDDANPSEVTPVINQSPNSHDVVPGNFFPPLAGKVVW